MADLRRPSWSFTSSCLRVSVILAPCLCLIACAEFTAEPTRLPARAVTAPTNRNTGGGEAMSGNSGNLNFLTVDFGNNKNEPPRVHTIVDDIRGAASSEEPATRPAQGAAAAGAATQPASPTLFNVVAQDKPADQFSFSQDHEGNATLYIFSPSGIGSVTLQRNGDSWPAVLHVKLSNAPGKPFRSLESFGAVEVLGGDRKIDLKTKSEKTSPDADILIPGFTRSEKITIAWIDAFR